MIQLHLVDLALLNVSREAIAKKLWAKLGNVYLLKSLVNKSLSYEDERVILSRNNYTHSIL